MGKKRARWVRPEVKDLLPELFAPDDETRGHAVRGLCPCHTEWEAFECNVSEVMRLLRDRSRFVRAQALHVFDDAAILKQRADLNYVVEPGEERIGEKRACHFRSMEERLEASRRRREEKRKTRHRLQAAAHAIRSNS